MWTPNRTTLVYLMISALLVVIVVTIIALSITLEEESPASESERAVNFGITEKSAPTKPGSLAKRRGFILEQSDAEGVRIFATVNTGRPMPVSQAQLEKERNKLSANDEVVEFQLPTPMKSESLNAMENLQILAENIRDNRTSIPSLFDAFSQYFEVTKNEPQDYESQGDNLPDWLTLTYLGASVFLLKQMDTLLKLQPSRQFQSRALKEKPWDFNSLNLLFIEPGNATDVPAAVKNEALPPSLRNYLWAAHNIYTASQQPASIQCIWTAYCEEINNRAPVQGVTGVMARMNGIVMEMMSSSLSPSAALAKLTRSIFRWSQLDCATLFPACPPEAAADYLIKLATTPLTS